MDAIGKDSHGGLADRITLDEHGLCQVEHDASWRAEVSREVLQAILEVEERAIAANFLAWIIAGLAAMTLPNSGAFLLPLLGRLLAMFAARSAFQRLRASMFARRDCRRELRALTLALVVGGASCAPILAPILLDPFIHPARMIVSGSVVVGVTIVFSLLAPAPRLAAAYVGGFLVTFAAMMFTAQAWHGAMSVVGMCGLLAIVLIYGFAARSRHRGAAEMLVDNRRLSEELAESLAHAEFLALRDPLTGLLNRRAFFQLGDQAGPPRDRHVLTIDLDLFKAINDRHGHATGDRVLVDVGKALQGLLRELEPGDHYPARLGGEEFALVVDVASSDLARTVAEMARHAIAQVGRSDALPAMTTSASIGLCRWAIGESLDEVLSRADAALYQAKARGRDRVMRAAA